MVQTAASSERAMFLQQAAEHQHSQTLTLAAAREATLPIIVPSAKIWGPGSPGLVDVFSWGQCRMKSRPGKTTNNSSPQVSRAVQAVQAAQAGECLTRVKMCFESPVPRRCTGCAGLRWDALDGSQYQAILVDCSVSVTVRAQRAPRDRLPSTYSVSLPRPESHSTDSRACRWQVQAAGSEGMGRGGNSVCRESGRVGSRLGDGPGPFGRTTVGACLETEGDVHR